MKKIFALIVFIAMVFSVFAEDIFKGKRFKSNNSMEFIFGDDNSVVLQYSNESSSLFDYTIDEKNKFLILKLKELKNIDSVEGVEIEGLETINKDNLQKLDSDSTQISFLKFMLNNNFSFDVENDFEEVEFPKDNYKDFKKQLYNYFYYQLLLESGFIDDEEFDSKKDYEKLIKKEDKESLNMFLSSLNSAFSQIELVYSIFKRGIKFSFDSDIYYSYEINDNKIDLKESTAHRKPMSVFYESSAESFNSEFYYRYAAGNLILMREANSRDEFYDLENLIFNYTTNDEIKTDFGKVTFINQNNPKDKIKAEYEIKRNEDDIRLEIVIKSGKFKNLKIDANCELRNFVLEEIQN